MRCCRRLLNIPYNDHVDIEDIRGVVQAVFGGFGPLTLVGRRRLSWFGHIPMSSGLAKTIAETGHREGRRKKR